VTPSRGLALAEMSLLQKMRPIVVPALGAHSATVIMLHGLGDSGQGWQSLAPRMNLPHAKFIFPSAPSRPVTINRGASMPAWFDARGVTSVAAEDEEGILQTRDFVHSMVAAEVNAGIPSSRILIGGFSQGAAMVWPPFNSFCTADRFIYDCLN
jgi:lysophospholipase II